MSTPADETRFRLLRFRYYETKKNTEEIIESIIKSTEKKLEKLQDDMLKLIPSIEEDESLHVEMHRKMHQLHKLVTRNNIPIHESKTPDPIDLTSGSQPSMQFSGGIRPMPLSGGIRPSRPLKRARLSTRRFIDEFKDYRSATTEEVNQTIYQPAPRGRRPPPPSDNALSSDIS